MSKPKLDMEGWGLHDVSDQPSSLRSPQERNLLQFSPFAGFGEGPPSSMGRFRRVMTTVSGSNGPNGPTNLAFGQLSQLSSGNSADESTPSTENNETTPTAVATPKLKRQNANDELDQEESTGEQNGGNGGFSNSFTLSLDQAALHGKQSYPRRNTQKEESYGDVVSDMEPSQITAHGKHDSEEHDNSAPCLTSEGDAGGNRSESGGLKGITAALTKKLSQDGRVVRKISGLLSRSKHEKIDSQSEAKTETGKKTGLSDQRVEQGIPVRKGSVLGMLGRKERLPLRKRSFMKSPKRKAGRSKSDDHAAQAEEQTGNEAQTDMKKKSDGAPSEKEIKVTAVLNGFRGDEQGSVGDDDDATLTEDDLAKRAVQIEKFLNSVAFL